MADQSFAKPAAKLGADPPNAVAPTGGMGLVLDEVGKVPTTALVEAWHEVGAAGEPAFQNGWVNFDATRLARFFRDASGIVCLAGVIKSGTIATTAFTLPIGYRPSTKYAPAGTPLIFSIYSSNAFGSVNIDASGAVTVNNANTAQSLDGIHFRAEV